MPLPDEPDLTRELDAAEEIVMGRADKVEIQWGVRLNPGAPDYIWVLGAADGDEEDARKLAVRCGPGALVRRRTVTYGPWEPAPRGTPRRTGG